MTNGRMEATSQSDLPAASVAQPATVRPAFRWSRVQAVTLLARFIIAALAASSLAVMIQISSGFISPASHLGFGLALALTEIMGLALVTVEWRDYGWRALSRGAEVWPA